ncbi:histidine phosphatase family protein [Gluconacetobacter takamatsuzukensis]|uniref:Phosphoglycerate mutase n=1 Tax=Gluconacetobacter takamatsuzukensis TaxID=1286190 RepID=A0A7W4KBK5_9PROT|nr:histidine phosphatase family protein [Gluconacetobacter takamatsuzukensis]MBB2203840.1 phosphoglycerate mutase [Gluconacetobacter takamatsuzukensis]
MTLPPADPAASRSLLLARHPPVAMPPGTCYGRLDVALRPGWEAYADGLAVLARGAAIRVLHSAPAARCRMVAARLAGATGLELRIDPRLAELDFGIWEGRPWAEIDRTALDRWAADPEDFAPPGGESGAALRRRTLSFWTNLLHAGQPAGVIAHGGPLRLLWALARGQVPDLLAAPPPQGGAGLFALPAVSPPAHPTAACRSAPG